ncbi:MAG: FliM/FliN family flagellar motor switch protein [Fuerstiella sp.]
MTDSESLKPFNFASPGHVSGSVNRALDTWHHQACALLTENWQSLLGDDISVKCEGVDVVSCKVAYESVADPGYAASLKVGPANMPALATFPGRLVCTLVEGLLGSQGDDWSEYKPLTTVESSMLELLCGEVSRAIAMSWPEVIPLKCELESCVFRPNRSRIFAPDEKMLRRRLEVTTAFGAETAWLLLPQAGLAELGISDSVLTDAAEVIPDPRLREIAKQLPVEIVVSLGHTKVTLAEMNQLEIGDFLVLDQALSQPVEATLDGELQWLGMPCRIGRRQGIEIIASNKRQGGT